MKAVGALIAVCVCAALAACGGGGKQASVTTRRASRPSAGQPASAAHGSSKARSSATFGSPAHRSPVAVLHAFALTGRSLPRSDGDGDNPKDFDSRGDPDPYDGDDDRPIPASRKFPDADDWIALSVGRAASRAESRSIASIVERYFAAARAGNAAIACSMMVPEAASSLAQESSVKHKQTCKAAISALFKRHRHELSAVVKVVDVRLESGGRAEVVFGSSTMPASLTFLERQGGSWMIDQALGMEIL